MAKTKFNMTSDELSEYLLKSMAEKFDNSKKGTNTATKYSDLTLHNSIAGINPNEKVTVNGVKGILDINEDDHLVPLGDILSICEDQ